MNKTGPSYNAIIFDLDGTLIDSLHDIADSMNRVLTNKGLQTHGYDDYRYFIGNGLRVLVGRTLPEDVRTDKHISELYTALKEDYEKNCLQKTQLYPGIPELLDALQEKGYKMAILSNKADPFTKKIARKLLSKWPFQIVVGAKESIPRKPNPSGALIVSNHLKVSPENTFYVGDTSVDMKTACAAGMIPIGVSWGFRTKEELMEHGARAVIDKPIELLSLLNNETPQNTP